MLLTLSESASGFIQFMTILIIFIFVLGITFFTTKWIANYQKGKTTGANIEVIETYGITSNKYVQIIRIGEKYLAIAIGKDEITFLSELDEAQLHFSESKNEVMLDFGSMLEKVLKRKNKEREE